MGSKSSSLSTGDVPAGHVRRQQKIATHESDKRLCQAQWLRKALSCHFWCFFWADSSCNGLERGECWHSRAASKLRSWSCSEEVSRWGFASHFHDRWQRRSQKSNSSSWSRSRLALWHGACLLHAESGRWPSIIAPAIALRPRFWRHGRVLSDQPWLGVRTATAAICISNASNSRIRSCVASQILWPHDETFPGRSCWSSRHFGKRIVLADARSWFWRRHGRIYFRRLLWRCGCIVWSSWNPRQFAHMKQICILFFVCCLIWNSWPRNVTSVAM